MLENFPDQNIVGRFYISKEYFLFGKLIKYFKTLSNAYSQVENKPLFPVNGTWFHISPIINGQVRVVILRNFSIQVSVI